jgi:DNA mismatch endonuclease (patch repair protein)
MTTRGAQQVPGMLGPDARAAKKPSFVGLSAASPQSSAAARGSSKKAGTRCEVALRSALRRLGLRCRGSSNSLPGRPDFVFHRARVVVFCDGDFWHGRDLDERLRRLAKGHNPGYWVEKIRVNVVRDQKRTRELEAEHWIVLRLWETDILRCPEEAAQCVAQVVAGRRAGRLLKSRSCRARRTCPDTPPLSRVVGVISDVL